MFHVEGSASAEAQKLSFIWWRKKKFKVKKYLRRVVGNKDIPLGDIYLAALMLSTDPCYDIKQSGIR